MHVKIGDSYHYEGFSTERELPKLYKFMEGEYARLLLQEGKLRISTLYRYRSEENFGSHIGDAGEGTSTVRMEHEVIERNPDEQQAQFLYPMLRLEGCINTTIHNVVRESYMPNCFVYCLTKKNSSKFLKYKDFGNTCLKITNIGRLTFILDSELRKRFAQSKFSLIADCQYYKRDLDYRENWQSYHPALLKEKKHAYQKEMRLIFEGKEFPPEGYIDIQNDGLKDCFKKVLTSRY